MDYRQLKSELEELAAEVSSIREQVYYQQAWVGECRPSGNARGRVSTQYQLRSRQSLFDGKKSRYLKASEVPAARAAVERGRRLLQLEQQLQSGRRQLADIEKVAQKLGLSLPSMGCFEALTQSKSNEWSTKPCYIELVRTVLGSIDLDPATNERAQQYIQAKTSYIQEDDGFSKDWQAKTFWMNPPYGKSKPKASEWILKAIAAYDASNIQAAILLVRGDSKGMKQLEQRFPCCSPNHRIAFIDANGQEQGNPPPGYRFFYLGPDKATFKRVFSAIGNITVPA